MLIILAILAVLVTVFLSVVLQATVTTKSVGSLDGQYGFVLGNIDGITEADPYLTDLAMLGSHDATSNNITSRSKLEVQDAEGALGKFYPLVKGILYRYSKTQTVGLYEQLMQGARYLNLKCSIYTDGEWYGEHSLLSDKLEIYIKDLIRFLVEHPGEVVIAQFEPQYLGNGGTLSDLHNFVASVRYEKEGVSYGLMDFVYYDRVDAFNGYKDDGVYIGSLRYNDLTKNGTVAGVVLFEKRVSDRYNYWQDLGYSRYDDYYFDLTRNASNIWHHRMGSDNLFEQIDYVAELLDGYDYYSDKLRINQTQGSFTSNDIWEVFVEWSLLDFAKKHNEKLINHPNFDKWLKAMPIVLVDFVNSDAGNFNERVNQKIRQYNENLVKEILDKSS